METERDLESEEIQKRDELIESDKRLEVVELEDAGYAKIIAEHQLKRKNLQEGIIQGKHNVKRTALELKNIEILKWRQIKILNR